ncbi:hypothetical protein GCM10027029_32190 [Conyzicola lurida]|nr:HtaA domain-containing protein [Conyzicola lurida]
MARWVAGVVAVALVFGGSLVAIAPASAAPSTITGGSLSWGVDAGYRSVFTTRAQAGGATLDAATDTFSFPAATSSTYDVATRTGTLTFTGNARIGYFAGAPIPGTTAGNYFYISNPVVTLAGDTGTVSGLTAGDSHSINPELPTAALAQRTVANLDLTGMTPVVSSDGSSITLTAVPATITEAGAATLANYGSASDAAATKRAVGSALDPVTITLAVVAPVVATATTTTLVAPATATVGTAVTLSATVAPTAAAGSIEFFDGTTSLGTVPVASGAASISAPFTVAGTSSVTAVFTPTDAAAYAASTSTAATTVVSAVAVPTVAVSKTTLSADGETITVTGSGFLPAGTATNGTRPPLAGKFAGAYVAFGKYADVWKPSAGAASSVRKNDSANTKWLVSAADVATIDPSGSGAGAVLNADGTFSVTMTVKPGFTGELETGNYGIYTYGGGGVVYAPFETYTPITFVEVPVPTVAVSKTSVSAAGETITVTGSGFLPAGTATNGTRPPLAGKFAGAYVAFGKYADVWKPSAGAASSVRKNDSANTKWLVSAADVATIDPSGSGAGAVLNADGTFSVTMTVKPGFTGALETGNYGIYTYGGGGVVYAPFETYTSITFVEVPAPVAVETTTVLTASPASVTAGQTTTLTATVAPVAAGTVAFSANGAALDTVTVVGGVATLTTGALAAGTTAFTAAFTPVDATLFTASSGSLSVVATPVVAPTVTGLAWGVKESFRNYILGPIAQGAITPTGATVDTNGLFTFPSKTGGSYDTTKGTGTSLYSGSVRFTGHNGALDITLSDPAVRITSATTGSLSVKVNGGAAIVFATLDLSGGVKTITEANLSFAGVPATLTAEGAIALGSYAAGDAVDPVSFGIDTTVTTPEQPAPTATTTTLTAAPATVVAGSTTTLTATVAPTAAGTVTFRSGSTILGSAPVASGKATVTTAALTVGTKSYSASFAPSSTAFAGSAGTVTVTVAPAPSLPVDPTVPVTAGLDWGVKKSFREYIVGPIANGAITPSGVTATATGYGFASKTGGSYDQATGKGTALYSGAVNFTGHNGALDLTFSNPSVRVTSSTAASLILTVNGGSPVTFATLDLGAATKTTTDSTIRYAASPAVLTAEGSEAFGGFYEAGEKLDAVTFVITPAAVPGPVEPTPPTVTATTTKLTASPATVVEASTATLTARVSPATAGTVTFRSGTEVLGTASVKSGKATVTTEELTAGVVRYTATFKPTSALFGGSTGSLALTVSAAPVPAEPEAPKGGLDWGIKQSFREYIVGPIANGSIDVDGATFTNGIVGFAPTTDGTFDGSTGTGVFAGSVHFTGHGGLLDITLADPVVRIDSATAGSLLVDVNGTERVSFATLDLSAATTTATDDAVSFTGIPATLTAEGAASFDGFYEAGTELDPVDVQLAVSSGTTPPDPTTPGEPEEPTAPEAPAVTATSLALTASPVTVNVGGSTVLSAHVTPAAAGAVSFAMGQTTLGSVAVSGTGAATLTVDNLPAGVQTFTAAFAPSDAKLFGASTATAAVSVVEKTVGAGSLTWGVKESFRSYVTGPIAKGAITTSGVGSSGGQFTFGQSAGGSYDFATGLGTSAYSGSVRFTGHAGLLDITLSNPVVRVDSATQGTLLVSVNGGASTPFATLDLASGSRSTPDNTVSYAGVPAALTSQGAAVFSLNGSGFYAVGSALDPVSFVIGAVSSPATPSPTTIAAFAAARTAAATPPATTGITIAEGVELVEGGEVTITATGFQPNETGILVVIYSTPTVLSTNATADASGTVTWTGRLPVGLTGQHTLTFQGSVNRGVEITIATAPAAAIVGCVVDDATITWGFKESFRSYISGSIANGEWTVADGATYEVPNFGWSAGTGGYDAETGEGSLAFAGSIAFTGHGGVLNTTVSNPQVRFIDADSAVLLLDISGTTQDGAVVDTKAVEFAGIDLAGVLENDGGAVTITAAPAALTDAGAAAFGTYPAGEALDPITIAFSTAADCAVAAEDEPVTTATAAPEDEAAAPVAATTDLGWIIWVVLALLVIAVIVLLVIVLRRKK